MPINQSGQGYGLTPSPVMSSADYMTMSSTAVQPTGADASAGTLPSSNQAVGATAVPQANYWAIILAVIGLMVVVHIATEREGSDIEVAHVKIGVYNFLVIGIEAMLFIVMAKVILAKHPIPGLTQIVGAA